MLKCRDVTLPTKVCLVKAIVSPVVMYECEIWPIKKAECQRIDAFRTVVLEKTLESPLDCKEIQAVHPKGNQSWIFIRRTDAEAETPIFWPPDAESWLIWKDPDAGKGWRQEEKGMTEDEMVGWHHRLDDMSLSELRDLVMEREIWCAVDHRVTKSQTRLSNWTEPSTTVHLQNFSSSQTETLHLLNNSPHLPSPSSSFCLIFVLYDCSSFCLYEFNFFMYLIWIE